MRAQLRRYLYTEWGDPTFGARAAFVHKKFQDSKPSSDTQSSISKQCGLMARFRHIVNELKVKALQTSGSLELHVQQQMLGPSDFQICSICVKKVPD